MPRSLRSGQDRTCGIALDGLSGPLAFRKTGGGPSGSSARAPCGRAPVDGDGSADRRASRGADRPVRRRDVPHRDLRGPGDCVAGHVADPRAEAGPGADQLRPHGRRARRLHLAGLHLGRAGARRVARRRLLLRGLRRAGRGDAGDRPEAPSGRPARGHRRCHRRPHRGGRERVGPVERRRPRHRHGHVDVGNDARRPRRIPHHRRRAAGAGAPRPLGAPPPGGPGLPLRGRRGLLARLRPRLPAVPGLGHGGGAPRRGLDGRRHPDRHLHVASYASDARGRGARAGADAPGAARPRHPPAPGPPGPARRHLRPRRGDPPRPRGSPGCSS